MKKRSRHLEVFNLSFLDVVSCSFGAVVLIVLLSKSSVVGGVVDVDRISELLKSYTQTQMLSAEFESQLQQLSLTIDEQAGNETQLQSEIKKARQTLAGLQIENANLTKEIGMLQKKLSPPAATIATDDDAQAEVVYAGGIPVDANFIIFIVDTSGSMQAIWPKIMAQMENILNIHPKVKGFQVLNDNGKHLFSAYQRKWISDTPTMRKHVLRLMRTWKPFSNSSPVEGLQRALMLYVKADMKVSIYILGDDYTGSSYDPVLQTIAQLNTNKRTGEPMARIHAISFYNPKLGDIFRLSTLMREVTRQSRGTFIALD